MSYHVYGRLVRVLRQQRNIDADRTPLLVVAVSCAVLVRSGTGARPAS